MEASPEMAQGARGEQAAAISNEAVHLLREFTGRGPTKARTTIGDEMVTILMRDTLTTGERKLVEHGKGARVLETRHDYQMAMREDLVSAVERQTDRTVVGFMSANHLDPDLAVEVFVLGVHP